MENIVAVIVLQSGEGSGHIDQLAVNDLIDDAVFRSNRQHVLIPIIVRIVEFERSAAGGSDLGLSSGTANEIKDERILISEILGIISVVPLCGQLREELRSVVIAVELQRGDRVVLIFPSDLVVVVLGGLQHNAAVASHVILISVIGGVADVVLANLIVDLVALGNLNNIARTHGLVIVRTKGSSASRQIEILFRGQREGRIDLELIISIIVVQLDLKPRTTITLDVFLRQRHGFNHLDVIIALVGLYLKIILIAKILPAESPTFSLNTEIANREIQSLIRLYAVGPIISRLRTVVKDRLSLIIICDIPIRSSERNRAQRSNSRDRKSSRQKLFHR